MQTNANPLDFHNQELTEVVEKLAEKARRHAQPLHDKKFFVGYRLGLKHALQLSIALSKRTGKRTGETRLN